MNKEAKARGEQHSQRYHHKKKKGYRNDLEEGEINEGYPWTTNKKSRAGRSYRSSWDIGLDYQ